MDEKMFPLKKTPSQNVLKGKNLKGGAFKKKRPSHKKRIVFERVFKLSFQL